MICGPTCPKTLYATLAALKIGAIARPVNINYGKQQLIDAINEQDIGAGRCAPELLVLCGDTIVNSSDGSKISAYEMFLEIKNQTSIKKVVLYSEKEPSDLDKSNETNIVFDDKFISWNDFITNVKEYESIVEAAFVANSIVLDGHTSGSTGKKKTSQHSNENILATISKLITVSKEGVGDSALIALPIDILACFVTRVLLSISKGEDLVMYKSPDEVAANFLNILLEHNISVVTLPPIFWEILYATLSKLEPHSVDLSSLKYITTIGNPMTVDFKMAFYELGRNYGINVYISDGFGLTECTAGSSYVSPEVFKEIFDTIGIPLPGVTFRIMNNDETECDFDETGRLTFTADNIAAGGFLDNEELNLKVIRKDSDGVKWFLTTDVAMVLGGVNEGTIRHKGRMEGLYNINGNKVEQPLAEDTVNLHPAVLENMALEFEVNKINSLVYYVVVNTSDNIKTSELKAEIIKLIEPERQVQYIPSENNIIITSEPIIKNQAGKPIRKDMIELCKKIIKNH